MPRPKNVDTTAIYQAAIQGLELQRQKLEEQIRHVRSLIGGGPGRKPAAAAAPAKRRKRRPLSAEARKRIAVAQKKRWAEFRKKQSGKG
jgi:hypothetical protein